MAKIQLLPALVLVSIRVHRLGVTTDYRLTMTTRVSCQQRPVVQSPSTMAADNMVRAFASTRLNYSNSPPYGTADDQMQRLQSLHNATRHQGSEMKPQTPVELALRWPPGLQQILVLAITVYKGPHGVAPAHLAADICKTLVRHAGLQWTKVMAAPVAFALSRRLPRTFFHDKTSATAGAIVAKSLTAVKG